MMKNSSVMVKVCGLKQKDDVVMCDSLGVNFVGFIFYKKSPRYVDPSILLNLPKLNAKKVGVFVDHSVDEILTITKEVKLDYIQLHGDYGLEECFSLGKDKIIKVIWPERYSSFYEFQMDVLKYKDACSFFLIDSGKTGGGHGREVRCDWLKQIEFPKKWFLAGGVGCENVLSLIKRFSPDGVDINSSVEMSPGKKDIVKIEEILKKLKGEGR